MSNRHLTPKLLLAVLVLGSGLGTGLGLSEAPTSNKPGASDWLELNTTRVVAGQQITGQLVIDNRSRWLTGHDHGCLPTFDVILANARYQPAVPFAYTAWL